MKRTTYIIIAMLTLTLFALLSSIFFVVQRKRRKTKCDCKIKPIVIKERDNPKNEM